jgi:hypothetical protein
MSAAFAYFPRFISGEVPRSLGLVAKRIGTLYIAHLSSIAIGFAIYALATVWLARPELMLPDERHWILDKPVEALAGIGLLSYQTGNFNILPMYMVMLALLPLIMLLARVRLSLALGVSFLGWLVANWLRLGPPNWPGQGVWFFNPFAWQFLFTIGFVGGVMLRRGQKLAFSPVLYGLALAYLAAAAILVMGDHWDKFPVLPEWIWISGFNKSWVGVFRLLHVLALVYVVVFSPLPAYLQRRLAADNWIVSLGRNTLPVFWTSVVLAVAGHILREDVFLLPNDPTFTLRGIAVDTALIGIGLVLLFALAFFLDWTKPGARRSAAPAQAPLRALPSSVAAE